MARGHHKAHCVQCNATTWHYTSEAGETICCTHTKGLLTKGRISGVVTRPKPTIAGRLNRSMFRLAERRRASSAVLDGLDGEALFGTNDKDPNKEYCSYCGLELQDTLSTLTEKKPVLRFKQEIHKDNATGEISITEKVTSRSEEFKACPGCVLQIQKPVVVRRV